MSTNRTLLYTSSVYDTITSWSKTKDLQDGLNSIKKEYDLIDESEDDILNIVYEWSQNDLNDLLGEFRQIQDVVITGTLGLWNGRRKIEFVREDNLKDAFWRCAEDMDEVKIYDNNGVIEIVAYHHDGYNRFYIYQLSSKGVNAGDNADLEKKTYHKKIRLH